uniref:hypothetical protein n=1 Tax=Geminisphaera colitermitum TaxID=1148786 RepID=UPI0005BB6A1A
MTKKRLPALLGLALAALTATLLFSGCNSSSKTKNYPVIVTRFLIEARANEAGAPVTLPQSGLTFNVRTSPQFTEYDIVKVTQAKSDLGPFLVFQLTPQAARDLYRFSVTNQGLRLLLTLNGDAVGARLIDGAFADGTIMTYVEVDDDELPDLVKNINKTSTDIQV